MKPNKEKEDEIIQIDLHIHPFETIRNYTDVFRKILKEECKLENAMRINATLHYFPSRHPMSHILSKVEIPINGKIFLINLIYDVSLTEEYVKETNDNLIKALKNLSCREIRNEISNEISVMNAKWEKLFGLFTELKLRQEK